MPLRRGFRVTGIVQGVGFRPFVYQLAREHGLSGFVLNDGEGVLIEAEGDEASLAAFGEGLSQQAPVLAKVERLVVSPLAVVGEEEFSIRTSAAGKGRSAAIPPDVALCALCRQEMLDPQDRRYRYPFINCTHCGPRLTIVEETPYDRARTTMAGFPLCPDCAREYSDPGDRRFHAEPVACAVCGPSLTWFVAGQDELQGEEALAAAVALLARGGIVALKGLGGFHLACRADHAEAVVELRQQKQRPAKPFAVMVAGVEELERIAVVSPVEAEMAMGPESPITLLRKREDFPLAPGVAPGVSEIGVMTPYTPLHLLLFHSGYDFPALVMTSGNRRDEPIARTRTEAEEALTGIADGFLFHDRPIHNRVDDSIARILPPGRLQVLRRARGFVPRGIPVTFTDSVFAAGAELKSTFCLTRRGTAFLSQHLGDLDEERAFAFYRETYEKFCRLLDLTPEKVICDRHPDYLSTRFAERLAAAAGLPLVKVQHHRAHVAAVFAECGFEGNALGVALDGTGFGDDGTIWGGEFFLCRGAEMEQWASLDPFPLPGGDAAVKQVWRVALALLDQHGISAPAAGSLAEVDPDMRQAVSKIASTAPLTSSMGRLFDAASVLAGLGSEAPFEAGAAMALEGVWPGPGDPYPFTLAGKGPIRVNPGPMLAEMVDQAGDAPAISARFHATVAALVLALAERARAEEGIQAVALGGGVFQNRVLASEVEQRLVAAGFDLLVNRLVPANDGGIALGQAWLGAKREDG